jgi:hypothetical protein
MPSFRIERKNRTLTPNDEKPLPPAEILRFQPGLLKSVALARISHTNRRIGAANELSPIFGDGLIGQAAAVAG